MKLSLASARAVLISSYVTLVLAQNSPSATSARSTPSSTTSSPFELYTIRAENITAVVVPYGARLTSLLVPDRNGEEQDIALGYDTGEEYQNDTATVHTYVGAVVGRYANRIKNGTFSLGGKTYHVPTNENGGLDTLHGGTIGYDQRNWTIASQSNSSITLLLLDEDNFQGFPGRVLTSMTFSVSNRRSGPQGEFRPRLTTKLVSTALDQATPIMLSNHIYWNLNAFKARTMLNDTHIFMPYSRRFIETDSILIPTGKISPVTEQAGLNFLAPQVFGTAIDSTRGQDLCGYNCTGIDNAFILDRPRWTLSEDSNFPVLSIWSGITGIQMDLSTNQQGIQIYSCNSQNGSTLVKPSQVRRNQNGGGGGNDDATDRIYKHGCVAIEPQAWIDGINHPEWGVGKYEIFSPETGPAVNYATYDFSTFH